MEEMVGKRLFVLSWSYFGTIRKGQMMLNLSWSFLHCQFEETFSVENKLSFKNKISNPVG